MGRHLKMACHLVLLHTADQGLAHARRKFLTCATGGQNRQEPPGHGLGLRREKAIVHFVKGHQGWGTIFPWRAIAKPYIGARTGFLPVRAFCLVGEVYD